MVAMVSRREKFNQVWFSFPIQLLLLHIKRNHFLLFFWFLLFGIINQWFFTKYGIHTLFISPEYLGKTDFFAFGILGFAYGGFVMGFHLYTYVSHGFRFRFLLSVSRPFFKFSINNFIIPVGFFINFMVLAFHDQVEVHNGFSRDVVFNLLSFAIGGVLFAGMTYLYFLSTNKDALSFLNAKHAHISNREEKIESTLKRSVKIWRVDTYINFPLRISHARDVTYYKDDIILQVMRQNYLNGSIFEMVTIISFVTLGCLIDYTWLTLPTGASILLLFSAIFMAISAFFSFFKGWSTTLVLVLFIGVQVLSLNTDLFKLQGELPGLDYQAETSVYPPRPTDRAVIMGDFDNQLNTLINWRKKFGKKNPKLVLINCSGGGMRSALWSFGVLSKLHHATNGQIFDNTFLINGSSGGIIGANYYRQLVLDSLIQPFDIQWDAEKINLGKDLLNPVTASLVMRDFFLRFQKYEYGGKTYLKDRAYAFDTELNRNTGGRFNHPLGYYRSYEESATIPGTILAPTNPIDGRRVLVSATPVRHFQIWDQTIGRDSLRSGEDWDLRAVLPNQKVESIPFTSLLRASASFPYILPNIELPTNPPSFLMDAGIRDNFGIQTTIRFLYIYRDWIAKNTSGVLLINMRDHKRTNRPAQVQKSLLGKIQMPVSSIYDNLFRTQSYQQERELVEAKTWLNTSLDAISLELATTKGEKISLNFHLSPKAQRTIERAVESEEMQQKIDWIKQQLPH